MKYKYLFFDLDRTLLDFDKAEHQAFFISFPGATEKDYQTYTKINNEEWEKYELGNISRSDVCVNRFARFFNLIGYQEDPIVANDRYMTNLGLGYFLVEGALEVLDHFKNKATLIVTTNGTSSVQRLRLEKSGLLPYFSKIVISEEIGHQKPTKEYFQTALALSGASSPSEVLVIGDSPLADIKGGQSISADTCWYNQNGLHYDYGITPTYEIHDIKELITLFP